MKRRALFGTLLALPALGLLATRENDTNRQSTLLQVSPVAGFQYHDGPVVWDCLRPGDRLNLVREPRNKHDERAVAVYWHGHRIGYLPRLENAAVAQMLDRKMALRAEVASLQESPSPWERVKFSVFLV